MTKPSAGSRELDPSSSLKQRLKSSRIRLKWQRTFGEVGVSYQLSSSVAVYQPFRQAGKQLLRSILRVRVHESFHLHRASRKFDAATRSSPCRSSLWKWSAYHAVSPIG